MLELMDSVIRDTQYGYNRKESQQFAAKYLMGQFWRKIHTAKKDNQQQMKCKYTSYQKIAWNSRAANLIQICIIYVYANTIKEVNSYAVCLVCLDWPTLEKLI